MTRNAPPRLAVSLLTRCLPEDDPLTGDLVEEFRAGRSRTWFWRQTLTAVTRRNRRGITISGGVVLAGLTLTFVAWAGTIAGTTELPEMVERFTFEEMVESGRNGIYHRLGLRGKVVEVTGVVDHVVSKPDRLGRGPRVLFRSRPFQTPRVWSSFALDASVDVSALAAGQTLTLRCPVGREYVGKEPCVVVAAQ